MNNNQENKTQKAQRPPMTPEQKRAYELKKHAYMLKKRQEEEKRREKTRHKIVLAMIFTVTLSLIMLGAVSMLCVKRGLGMSDRSALYFSLIQFLSCTGVSYLSGKIIRKLGARKSLFISFSAMLFVGVL